MQGSYRGQERRAHPRWHVALNVIYGKQNNYIATTSLELSESGISVYSNVNYEVGTELEIQLLPNDSDWIALKGTVRRVNCGVMALQFSSMPRKSLAKIGDYLRRQQRQGKAEIVGVAEA